MAIKIKKKYRVITAMNPKTKTKDLLRPVVTERETYYSDNVVEYALKNGYVRGQYHDMLGALNGFIQAVQELGKEGKDVNLSNWLRVHGELTGTVDPKDPVLTEKNSFRVNITALKELKRKASDFSWTRVADVPDNGPALPRFTRVVSQATGAENTWKIFADTLNGEVENLTDDTTVSIELFDPATNSRVATLPLTDENSCEKTATGFTVKIVSNTSTEPDMVWQQRDYERRLCVTNALGSTYVVLAAS